MKNFEDFEKALQTQTNSVVLFGDFKYPFFEKSSSPFNTHRSFVIKDEGLNKISIGLEKMEILDSLYLSLQ